MYYIIKYIMGNKLAPSVENITEIFGEVIKSPLFPIGLLFI